MIHIHLRFMTLMFLVFLIIPLASASQCVTVQVFTAPQLFDNFKVDGAFRIDNITFGTVPISNKTLNRGCAQTVSPFTYILSVSPPAENTTIYWRILEVPRLENEFFVENLTDVRTGDIPIWLTSREGQYVITLTPVNDSNVTFYRYDIPNIFGDSEQLEYRAYIYTPLRFQTVVDVPPAWQREWEKQQDNWNRVQNRSSSDLLTATSEFVSSSKRLETFTILLITFAIMQIMVSFKESKESTIGKWLTVLYYFFSALFISILLVEYFVATW